MNTHPDTFSAQSAALGVTSSVVLNAWRPRPETLAGWIELAREYTDCVPDGIPGTVWRRSFRATLTGQRMIEV